MSSAVLSDVERRAYPAGQLARQWLARASGWPLVVGGALGVALGGYAVGVAGFDAVPTGLVPQLVIAMLAPFLAVIVGDLRRVLLALVLLDLPLQIDAHLSYRDDVAQLGALVGWNVSLTTGALIGLYAIWLLRTVTGVGPRVRPAFRASLPFAAFVATTSLSVSVAYDLTLAAFEAFLLVQMLLLCVYLASWIRTREDVTFVVALLLAGLAFEGALMIASRIGGEGFKIPVLMSQQGVAGTSHGASFRPGGSIGSANSAAAYLSMLLVPTLTVFLSSLSRRHKQLALVALGAGGVALILTLSRGGWTALALGIVIVCVLSVWRGWLSPGVPLLGLAVLIAAAFFQQDLVLGRFLEDDKGSAVARIPLMDLAFRIIADHPILGVGANNFAVVMPPYVTPNFAEYAGDWLYIVHNKYLLIWAETGALGLAAFAWFLGATIVDGWRGWRLNDRLLSPLALGFTGAVVGHLFHMSVDLFTGRPEIEMLTMCAAVAAAIAAMRGVLEGDPGGMVTRGQAA
jgi:putative inorganic carbon (hco3(-)) transporter